MNGKSFNEVESLIFDKTLLSKGEVFRTAVGGLILAMLFV